MSAHSRRNEVAGPEEMKMSVSNSPVARRTALAVFAAGLAAVCRQNISDGWLGNLRECLAHLV